MCAGEIGIVMQGWIDGCLALANSVRSDEGEGAGAGGCVVAPQGALVASGR